RVAYRYFFPCGRCRACLRQRTKSCPERQANWLVSCEAWPHFQGGFGQYFYLRPNHAVFKLPDEFTDEMAAGVNCAYTQVYAGLDLAGLRAGQIVVIQGAGGLGVYACAVAREMGAACVIVIDGVDERLELARRFGARKIVGLAHYEAEHLRGALDLMHRTLTRYPWEKVVSHKFPLEAINDAFVQQDQGHVTRAAIVPN